MKTVRFLVSDLGLELILGEELRALALADEQKVRHLVLHVRGVACAARRVVWKGSGFRIQDFRMQSLGFRVEG